MTDGEEEVGAIRGERDGRTEEQKRLPQTEHPRSHSHRCSGMPGVRPLHGIHGKSTDSIDAQLIDLFAGELNRYRVGHHRSSLYESSNPRRSRYYECSWGFVKPE